MILTEEIFFPQDFRELNSSLPNICKTYLDKSDGSEHLVMIYGALDTKAVPLVRIHSECITGDIFGSLRCDCGEQFQKSIEMMRESSLGIMIYLFQEGRGIGLINKIHAYKLQEDGYDTVQANTLLGFKPDQRNYIIAGEILKNLGFSNISLITNNPAKIEALELNGITVSNRLSINPTVGPYNQKYLETKVEKMSHRLKII